MRMYDLIRKKRDGETLSKREIEYIVRGFTDGLIPDYQMAALAMAIYFRGMDSRETADLTMAMAASGEMVDLSSIEGVKVDKHSTGGVGDTTTLVLAPLVAAAGVPVAKMSGRGLGHTGGTIDKLESIPGFSVELTEEQFVQNVNTMKLALIGQTGEIAPADKKLYALRDVTATVDTIPLIASSIMSKKLAAGADAIVLDVKTGEGAFMKTQEGSFSLAKAMVDIGTQLGRKTIAVVSDMNQPLGYAIGNALEVKEAIDTLQGRGPGDLEELCLELGSHMLVLAGRVPDQDAAKDLLRELIASGAGLEALKRFVQAQGGDPSVIDQPERLPQAKRFEPFLAGEDGYVSYIHAEVVGTCAMMLGAGRERKDSVIDLAVGIVLKKKVGDPVKKGEPLAILHVNDESRLDETLALLRGSFEIHPSPVPKPPLIYGIVTSEKIDRYY
ncbi:pyrimidine-nucleoside phosphorylase [Effusibacillus lacus]|uniref:Pyrimidine-nucleoside phosphorylase n=1 Tax=Effusibacillus lacus TaxID=1348429 RepID=A0A292YSG8_9BACL|nr:pyrimidine-nucleoside phosphorylase [Effusibacillus lacus]TCS76316.1 thymidine phosphorylase [Effusibacillus lacus]GAX91861.1 pyrimidine-nucleoside phosphorylase [Effusibacillus lacus]